MIAKNSRPIPPSPAEEVASTIVKRAVRGDSVSVLDAQREVGVSNLHTIIGTAGIQRALSRMIRDDDVAEMQLKCLKAFTYKMLKLPHKLDESEVEQIIKSECIAEVTREHVEGKGWFITYRAENYEYIDRALDKLYKIAGVYTPDKHKAERDLQDMTDEELLQITSGVISPQEQADAVIVDRVIP